MDKRPQEAPDFASNEARRQPGLHTRIWTGGVLAGVAAFTFWLMLGGPTQGPGWTTRILLCLVIGLLVMMATVEAGHRLVHAGKSECAVCGHVNTTGLRSDETEFNSRDAGQDTGAQNGEAGSRR